MRPTNQLSVHVTFEKANDLKNNVTKVCKRKNCILLAEVRVQDHQ